MMDSKSNLITYDDKGLIVATYDVVKEYLKNQVRTIFGNEVNIEDETPDGTLINLIAESMFDCMNGVSSVYQSLSRESAVGTQLDNFASLTNIKRRKATNSTAQIALEGIEGTKITNGVLRDKNGINWLLEPLVVIEKEKLYTAVCSVAGNIYAGPNEIQTIVTQVAGWTGATNPDASILGKEAENDAQLRYRIRTSFDITAKTVVNGLKSSLEELDGVKGASVYENDTDKPKAIIPTSLTQLAAHSIACVVNGGEENNIALTILKRKTPGIPTQGTTNISIDTDTIPIDIKFYKAEAKPIYAKITIIKNPLTYISSRANDIKEIVSKELTNLPIATSVLASNIIAMLSDRSVNMGDFTIKSVKLGKASTGENLDVIDLDFNETSTSLPSYITVEVA